MFKIVVLACTLGIAHSGVVPAIPQQYLQQAPQAYSSAPASPVLPPHLAAQVRALPPVFRSAAPAAQPAQQVYQAAPQQVYQAAPQQAYQQVAPQQVYQPAPQPQYRAQPAPRPQAALAPQRRLPAGTQQLQDPEDYEPNPSYNFGFDVKDDQFTNYQNRKEQREGDTVKGSYSVVDSDGFIRTVTYTADPVGGFKAEVVREPTDIKILIPTPAPAVASAPQQYSRAGPQQAYAAQPAQYTRAQAAPAPQQAYAPQAYAAQPAPQAIKATYAQPIQQYQG